MRNCANPFKTKLRHLLFLQFQGHRRCPWIHTSDICSCWTLDARGLLSRRTSTIRIDQSLNATNVNNTSGRQSLTQMHIVAYTTAARKGVEMAANCTALLDNINWGLERRILVGQHSVIFCSSNFRGTEDVHEFIHPISGSCWTLDARGLLSRSTSTIRTDQSLKATNVNSTSGRQSLTQMHIAAYTTAARKGVEMAADCTTLLDSINWGRERKD